MDGVVLLYQSMLESPDSNSKVPNGHFLNNTVQRPGSVSVGKAVRRPDDKCKPIIDNDRVKWPWRDRGYSTGTEHYILTV
jgi:hypothetical protein